MGQIEYNLPVLTLGDAGSVIAGSNGNDASAYEKLVPGNSVPDIVELLGALGVVQQEDVRAREETSTQSRADTSIPQEQQKQQQPPRYCIAGGRPRHFVVTPSNIISEINRTHDELEASLKRQKLLRQALNPSTSDKRAAQLLERLAVEYPQAVADDPVYITALRNMHIDVVAVLGKHSHAIFDGNVVGAGTGLAAGAAKSTSRGSVAGGAASSQKKGTSATTGKTGNKGAKRRREVPGDPATRKRRRVKKKPPASSSTAAGGAGSKDVKRPVPASMPDSSEGPTSSTDNGTAGPKSAQATVETKSEPTGKASAPPTTATDEDGTGPGSATPSKAIAGRESSGPETTADTLNPLSADE
jgi:hypothetical protein